MKHSLTLTVLLCLAVISTLHAQRVELSAQAGPSLMHFSGNASASYSNIINGPTPYTNNPYGTHNAWGYGAGLQAQIVAPCGFIAGVQTGYEVLRSKVIISGIVPLIYQNYAISQYTVPVSGQSYLTSRNINVSPYIGWRLNLKKVKLDLMPGMDIGFNLNLREKGTATTTDGGNQTYKVDYKRPNAHTDARIKLGVAAFYKRFGITAGYAHGLTNYLSGTESDSQVEAYSNVFKVGLSYRLL